MSVDHQRLEPGERLDYLCQKAVWPASGSDSRPRKWSTLANPQELVNHITEQWDARGLHRTVEYHWDTSIREWVVTVYQYPYVIGRGSDRFLQLAICLCIANCGARLYTPL